MAPSGNDVEPFPTIEEGLPTPSGQERPPTSNSSPDQIVNRPAASSSLSGRLRRASKGFEESSVPEGFMAATGSLASSLFSMQSAVSLRNKPNDEMSPSQLPSADANPTPLETVDAPSSAETSKVKQENATSTSEAEPPAAAPFDNGYHFPPRHTFAQSSKLGLMAFWKYVTTPLGFAVTIYGLNVVAWGGMLFLLLCNASPAMCHPDCDDINSPRRIWIEIDSQILNALFCVTGFGLAPWRFRDLWYLMKYRIMGDEIGLRRLAGINRAWFRLPGSTDLPISVGPDNIGENSARHSPSVIPYPETAIPDAPLTGVRARPTRVWKLDLVIWLMVWNTFLQAVLSGFMWGMNRYNRPSWATGLFIGLAFTVAGIAGYIIFLEGKAVNTVEGVPVSDEDLQRLKQDREKGIFHFNNIKDKDMTPKDGKEAKR
ncbi:hypothetical protein B0I35DRAFT_410276 [Stachybotrys elegans]|uniref:Uncharacterized protein n=1 Tax=Stachybotrys elegans TaxID=80388 RepID=A0A8K0SLG0_9HYPO|nr:hypothetical protein B0I35DRAFT_410276 [Stachybotrys elegans]